MCVQSQSDHVLEYVNDEPNFAHEKPHECGVVAPLLQGLSRTISCPVSDTYRNADRYRLNCEIWIRFAGLDDADYVVALDWIGINHVDLCSQSRVASKGCVVPSYSGSCYLRKSVFIGIGQVPNHAEGRRQNGVFFLERLQGLQGGGEPIVEPDESCLPRFGELVRVVDYHKRDRSFLPVGVYIAFTFVKALMR